jgi:hypothetical protein
MDAAYRATEKEFARGRLLEKGAAAMLMSEHCNTGELEVIHEALGEAIQTYRKAEETRETVKQFHSKNEPPKRRTANRPDVVPM